MVKADDDTASIHMETPAASSSRISFFTSSSVIFAGSLVVNVLNYVFTLVMSRLLAIEDFGEVAALLSLFLIISVPGTALAMLMAREAASGAVHGLGAVERLFIILGAHTVKAALALLIAFLIFVPLLSEYLHIPIAPIYVFSLLVPLTLLSSLQSGTLQGLQEFFSLSAQSILGTLIKLIAAIILVGAGFSVSGVMGALVLSALATFLYGFWATRIRLVKNTSAISEDAYDSGLLAKLFGSILLTSLLLALLSNIDILLAKHYLAPDLAGQYGALSALGKILIYGVGAFISVLLPMASAAHARGHGEEKRLLALSLASVALASLGAFAVFSLFPHLVVSLLFGARYADIAGYLGIFSIAMTAIALSTVFINYFVATRNTSFVYLLGLAIAIEVALISINHASLVIITHMLVISSAILLVFMVVNFLVAYRRT